MLEAVENLFQRQLNARKHGAVGARDSVGGEAAAKPESDHVGPRTFRVTSVAPWACAMQA